MKRIPSHSPMRHQRGFAAILAVLLAGLGIAAATVAAMYSVRGAQDANLAVHQSTQAQARAWQAVEIVRLALKAMPADTLNALPAGNLAITGLSDVSAEVMANTASGSGRRITVQITATGASGSASSSIEAVYQIVPGASGDGGGGDPDPVNINGDLILTGGITVMGGSNANLVVSGLVELTGSVSGINKLCAGGNITIGANNSVNEVCTNGNLTLTGGAEVGVASVKGNVTMSGGTSITTLKANGDVTLGGGGSINTLSTKGNVVVQSGSNYAKTIVTEGNVTWESSSNKAESIQANGNVIFNAASPATVIRALGNITLDGNGQVLDAYAGGSVFLKNSWNRGIDGVLRANGAFTWNTGNHVNNGIVGGSISPALPPPAWAPVVNVVSQSGFDAGVAAVTVATITHDIRSSVNVDAYTLEEASNYAFRVDGQGRKKVTVRNVSNIADGTYFLGTYTVNHKTVFDYLCTTIDDNGKCLTPEANQAKTICEGYSPQNGCFSYNDGRWTIAGNTIAPGVAWFEGSLTVSNGIYFNSFIATKNISTAGGMKTYSVNYAGYDGICANTALHDRASYSRLDGMYPTNYCDTSARAMTPEPLGNYAYIAGSYKDGQFQGGNISLGAGNEVFGSILAGNLIDTSGNTTVHGVVYTGNKGEGSRNSWSGRTTVDLTNLPTTVELTKPCELDNSCSPTGTTSSASVFWTRYL